MHPVIKIVSLVILSIFSTQGGWYSVFLTIFIITPFYIFHAELLSSAIKMTLKLKWLFFSILLVYFIFSPGTLQVLAGFQRVVVLISIIFSVNLYLKTTTMEQILESLLWLFSPLKYLKINVERLSLRAVLTLEYIDVLKQHLEEYQNNFDKNNTICNEKSTKSFIMLRKERLTHLIKHFSIVFQDTLAQVSVEKMDSEVEKQYTIDCIEAPHGLQLAIPIVLGLLYFFNPLLSIKF